MKKLTLILCIIMGLAVITNAQNNALDFDGTDDYVTCGSMNLSGSAVTLEAWINVDVFHASSPFITSLFGIEGATNVCLLRLGDIGLAKNKLQFALRISGANIKLNGNTALATNTWYHVAATYDGATMKIYVNGILDASSSPNPSGSFTANDNFLLAKSELYPTDRYLDGQIDEVRIWSDARSQAEIRANMYQELEGNGDNLVAYYKLNETTGTTASDSQDGTYDGTLTGTSFSFDNNAFPSPAFFGPKNCLTFNGTDEMITFSPNPSFTDPITIEAWVKTTSNEEANNIICWGRNSGGTDNVQFRTDVGKLEFGMDPGGSWQRVISTQSVNTENWVHVAVVKSGSNVTLYINGVVDGFTDAMSNSVTVDRMEIAKYYNAANYFSGSIDEVRIWNTARSKDEIRANMYHTLTGSESGLVAYYNFDNASGTTLQDVSGSTYYEGTLLEMDNGNWANSTAFNSWLNTNSTAWATDENWSDGGVPTSTDNVGIDNYSGSSPACSGSPTINNLVVGSSAGMTLASGFTINGNLFLNDGIDLNGQTITLGSSATLYEDNGLISGSTGTITTTRDLSTISADDVAGLGATITTTANMGSTTIIRGHGTSGINGLDRYYQINPTTNTSLDATLVFYYDDSEINPQTEASLKLYKSSDGSTWSEQASSSVSEVDNTLTLTGIDSFSWWTGASDRAPDLTTQDVTSILKYTATGNGNITDLGKPDPTEHGVCWSTSSGPTTSDSKTTDGSVSATGAFTSSITGLVSNTIYYVKAYATNATGTSYGDEVSFTSATSGADTYSVQSGDWNTASTWNNGVPGNNETVDILSGHTVTLDVDMASSGVSLNVEDGGTLTSDGAENGIFIKTGGAFTVYGIVYVYSIDLKNNVDPKYIYSTGDVTVWNFFDHSGPQSVPITVDGKLTILSPGTLLNGGDIIGTGTITAANYSGTGTLFGITPTSSITGGTSVGGFTWDGSSTAWNTTDNWISGVVPSLSTDDVVIPGGLGTYPSISTTGNNCRNILIESGGELTIDVSSDITVSGTLTLESDANGTGSLINYGTITGDITMERYLAAATWTEWDDGWHFLSSPVADYAIASNFTTVDPADYDFYAWSEPNNIWVNYKDGTSPTFLEVNGSTTFELGTGYLAAYKTTSTKEFSGTMNVNDIAISNLTITSGTNYYSWHLLGNPYPSALTWFTDWTTNNYISSTAKIWNEVNKSYTALNEGDPIPATNGFMVQAVTSTGTLTIPAAKRLHSSQAFYKSTEYPIIKLKANNIDNPSAQESEVRFNPESTTGYEMEFDSDFLPGYAPLFYSLIDNRPMAVNGMPDYNQTTNIPFTFIKNEGVNFSIEMYEIENMEMDVWLLDRKLNKDHNLTLNPAYYFTAFENDDHERFVIHFSPVGIEDDINTSPINIFAANSKVEVRSNKPVDAQINIYNISGQLLNSRKLSDESSTSIKINNYKGPAIVSIITNERVINKKVIIW